MKRIVFLILLMISVVTANATHIIGAEVGYRHISGLEYEVLVNIYGDCNLNPDSSSYPTFSNATRAEVEVYNGTNLYATISCEPYGNFGEEVTPLCKADSGKTKCHSLTATIPGISRFQFRKRVTLNTPSQDWRFAYAGQLGTSLGGRSASITNVNLSVGSTVAYLEATLNNTNGPNSSALLTTVPTPFFCVNQLQQYNPGAIDADADSLNFELVPGLRPNGTTIASVIYVSPYTATQPLAASSLTLNKANGQLNFVPNQVQTSLVVNRIEEYRNGQLVGSAMREMNFIVLNNCSNQSPGGSIGFTSKGDITSPNVIEICNADSNFSFIINAYDPDSGNIEATLSGVPSGLNYNIIGNNTSSPQINFTYQVPQPLIPGASFPFVITYQDDDCPISSKQQVAYTIRIVQPISLSTTTLPESCLPGADGIVSIAASSTSSVGVEYSFNGSGFTNLNTYTDLVAGIYPFQVRDSLGCTAYNNVTVDTPLNIRIDTIIKSDITCFEKTDGQILAMANPDSLGLTYIVLPGPFVSNNGLFEYLSVGNYTVIVNGPLGCSDTAIVSLSSPPDIEFDNISITNNRCDKQTGRIDIGSNIAIPAVYSISPNEQSNASGSFGGLNAGYYQITVIDTNRCYKDTLLEVGNEQNNFSLQLSKQDIICESDGNNGTVQVSATGGVEPYTYFWTSQYGTEGTQSSITNQRSGLKRVFVTDAIGCQIDDYIIIEPANCCENVFVPNAFTPNGDGQNEIFRLRTPLTMNEVKFYVVNRWGQKIWETNNHLIGWDGNHQDGTPADAGTYFYFLRYQCDNDKSNYTLKGDITVIR